MPKILSFIGMTNFFTKYRHWFLGITLALALVCGFLTFKVNINTDMTKYLPNDSRMRAGLEILKSEFGEMANQGSADIRVMCDGLSDNDKVEFSNQLRNFTEVNGVTAQDNGSRTLFELSVDSDIDQVALGKIIKEKNDKIEVVETSQDGATADAPMLIGAVCMLLIVLFLMCQSWLEPVLFLASTGIAVLLNVGTNALLPSVSATTNSIVAVLQLVLSMDYSIILINRFRQERLQCTDSITAMGTAIKKASASILSSAFTTITGLMMLVFMKLKIGTDLGVVLSKGVLCSLICNFTILPSLILLFEKGIDKSVKKTMPFPTDKLAAFNMKFRIPLAILFVIIFAGSYILHNQTNIKYLNSQTSKIEQYFPKKNPAILLYDNADEAKIVGLMDELMKRDDVEMVLSYPSLLLREYTAPKMVKAIHEMTGLLSHMDTATMPNIQTDMLSEDVLKVVYYAANCGEEVTMSFNEMTSFILQQASDPNSLIAKAMDEDFESKLDLLREFSSETTPATTLPVETKQPAIKNVIADKIPEIETSSVKNIEEPIKKEITTTAQAELPKSPYTDTTMILKPMTCSQIANFFGMDEGQAKMVFKIANRSESTMTPYQFVHFVTEDILKRRVLAAMIKNSQERALRAVQHTMDSTLTAAANSAPISIVSTVTTPVTNTTTTTTTPTLTPQNDTVQKVVVPVIESIAQPTKIQSNSLSALDKMLDPKNKFTASQMSKNLSLIGEDISEGLINMLYIYYGGNKFYDESWTMSLEQMVNYLMDSVMTDPRFSSFIDDTMSGEFTKIRSALMEGVGKMKSDKHGIAVIVTNLPTESTNTYSFIDQLENACKSRLGSPYYTVGESVMLSEMKAGFSRELLVVTVLTIIAIFIIVAITFRSLLLSAILVMTVMSGVFMTVAVSGLLGGSILYIAYLIVQSILMGAAIDYGILFANYYREKRAEFEVADALREAYKGSIHTILTSGLILILVPGAMSFLVSDPTVSDIVRSIAVGACVTVLLILFVLPGVLAICDKVIVKRKKR